MSPKHQTGLLFISYVRLVTDLNLLEYLF